MIDIKNFSILKKRIKDKVIEILYNNGVDNWIIKEFNKLIDDAKTSETEIINAVNWADENNNIADMPIIDYRFIRDELVKEGIDIHEWKAERYYKNVNNRNVFMPKLFADDLVKEFSFITTNEKIPELYLYDYEDGIYKNDGINFIDRFTSEFLGTEKDKHRLVEIIMHVKGMTFKDRDIFEKTDKSLICLNNGVYDISKDKLLMHSSDLIFLNKIPINYNPKADCPKIKEFLKEVLMEEDLSLANELMGYC